MVENQQTTDQRESRRQAHRVNMTRLVVFDVLGEAAMLGMFAYAGTIPAWVAITFAIVCPGIALVFFAIMKFNLNAGLIDRGMLIPQIIVQALIQLSFLLLAPSLAILFLLALLLLSAYAVLEFTAKQLTIVWIGYSVATAVALMIIGGRFSYPGTSPLQIALVWLTFVLALRLLTMVNVQFGKLRAQLTEKNRLLKVSLAQIEAMTSHDFLTGVYTRRNFMEMLEAELRRSERTGHEFCAVMLDFDHFKVVNDTFGHPVGDMVLKVASTIAEQALRSIDVVGRLGGEEFGILMPETPLDKAVRVTERIRTAIAAFDWNAVASGLVVTFSAGIAVSVRGDSLESIMKRADDAMYAAKRAGRDCTMTAPSIIPSIEKPPADAESADTVLTPDQDVARAR
jgi:diguanylate cyclase (GGDEF)-like protein